MFSERLNERRKTLAITAQEMADKLGIGIRAYRYYESGARQPSYEILVKIADLLDVSLDYLLCRDDYLQKSLGESVDEY